MNVFSKITKIYKRSFCIDLYTSTEGTKGRNQEIINIQIDTVCYIQINDHMHDRLLCSNVSFITHCIY